MAAILTKSETFTDSKGKTVTTETWEAFDGPPSVPGGATNIRRTHTDGKHTLLVDIPDSNAREGESYTVEGSMSQEPIETHEKFKDIAADEWKKWNVWKNNPNDDSLAGWNPAEQESAIKELAALYEKGVTDYLVPRAVVRITQIERSSPRLSRLGKITPPPSAPTLHDGANWMLTGASGNRQEDGTWSNSYEYMSSGPAGWNKEIYS